MLALTGCLLWFHVVLSAHAASSHTPFHLLALLHRRGNWVKRGQSTYPGPLRYREGDWHAAQACDSKSITPPTFSYDRLWRQLGRSGSRNWEVSTELQERVHGSWTSYSLSLLPELPIEFILFLLLRPLLLHWFSVKISFLMWPSNLKPYCSKWATLECIQYLNIYYRPHSIHPPNIIFTINTFVSV